jgi:hypothetical protein
MRDRDIVLAFYMSISSFPTLFAEEAVFSPI